MMCKQKIFIFGYFLFSLFYVVIFEDIKGDLEVGGKIRFCFFEKLLI